MSIEFDEERIFKALASGTRRHILDRLKNHPRTTGELCQGFPNLDRCTVMQHLGVLEEAGLVIVQRKGRHRWNYLNALPIKYIYDRWIGEFANHAVEMVAELKTNLEETELASMETRPGLTSGL